MKTIVKNDDAEPRVSIGLPVYNGQDFLVEAIESVLNQTFNNLELIISDNGSTDDTEAICRGYAEQDPRVRYYRSEQNHGASWNYNRTVEVARGEYFRWLAHDDLFAPALVEKSVRELDRNSHIISCITWFLDIDEQGNPIEVKSSTVQFDAPRPNLRYKSMSSLRPSYNCEEVFGMVRLAVLRQTNLIANYVDSDRSLIAELGLHGPFAEVKEPLFLHRVHAKGSVVVNPTRQERAVWFDPSKEGKLVFPHWRQFFELLATINRSPISIKERARCYFHMLNWVKGGRLRLGDDLAFAFRQVTAQSG